MSQSKRKIEDSESNTHKRVKKESSKDKDKNKDKDGDNHKASKKTAVVNLKGRKPQIIKEEVYCGRNMYMGGWKLKQSKYFNPFKVGKDGDLGTVIKKYKKYLNENESLTKGIKEELKGKILACWCAPAKCHCDVLAELADAD